MRISWKTIGRRWRLAAAFAATLAAVPALARAQGAPTVPGALRGVVLSSDSAPVSGASVTLAPPGGGTRSVLTGDDGAFYFPGVEAGAASLRVRRIGFRAESLTVTLPLAEGRSLAVRLTVVPQALATVVVKGRPELRPGPIRDFYRRKENGFGRYITRADIERRHPTETTDLLRTVPGMALYPRPGSGMMDMRIRGNSCAPEVFIDGTPLGPAPMDMNGISPGTIEGIEIYSSGATVPVEFTVPFGRAACGTVLVWTREGEPRARREKNVKPVTSADLAALVEGLKLYTAEQVDAPAALDGDFLSLVHLPDSLRAWPAPAGVIVEFVVDTTGRVEAGTSNLVASPAAAFADAVRAALPVASFTPARLGGRAVRQLVQLSVRFDPPSKRGS